MVKAVMDCSSLREFDDHLITEEFINADGALKTKSYMRSDWWHWNKMDPFNRELIFFSKQLSSGMTNP